MCRVSKKLISLKCKSFSCEFNSLQQFKYSYGFTFGFTENSDLVHKPIHLIQRSEWAKIQFNLMKNILFIPRRRKIDKWGGGLIFLYSCSVLLVSFEIHCFQALSIRLWILAPRLSIFHRPCYLQYLQYLHANSNDLYRMRNTLQFKLNITCYSNLTAPIALR